MLRNNKNLAHPHSKTQVLCKPPDHTESQVSSTHDGTPTIEVLNYIRDYYSARGISVTFILDDVIDEVALNNLEVDPLDGINDDEFWAIEKAYNHELYCDDRAKDGVDTDGTGYDMEFKLKEKWLLFGNTVEGEPNVVGYCWVLVEGLMTLDFIAGNYMFVADEIADNWETANGILYSGAEAVVVMHEMGHCIGIGTASRYTGEIYCDNHECVMAMLRTENADNYWAWFYCADHWATRNMDYYKVGWIFPFFIMFHENDATETYCDVRYIRRKVVDVPEKLLVE